MKRTKPAHRGATPLNLKKTQNYPKNFSLKVLMLAGVCIGIVLTILFRYTSSDLIDDKNISHKEKASSEKKRPQPVFDFYTSLAKGNKTQVSTTKNDPNIIQNTSTDKEASSKPITVVKPEETPKTVYIKQKDNNSIPSNVPKTAAKETVDPKATSSAQYILRAGSFRSSNDARKLLARLLLLGLSPYIEKTIIDVDTWYRVQVGPFVDKEKAVEASQILTKNHIDSFIVQR